jgi:hypothetical protein
MELYISLMFFLHESSQTELFLHTFSMIFSEIVIIYFRSDSQYNFEILFFIETVQEKHVSLLG